MVGVLYGHSSAWTFPTAARTHGNEGLVVVVSLLLLLLLLPSSLSSSLSLSPSSSSSPAALSDRPLWLLLCLLPQLRLRRVPSELCPAASASPCQPSSSSPSVRGQPHEWHSPGRRHRDVPRGAEPVPQPAAERGRPGERYAIGAAAKLPQDLRTVLADRNVRGCAAHIVPGRGQDVR